MAESENKTLAWKTVSPAFLIPAVFNPCPSLNPITQDSENAGSLLNYIHFTGAMNKYS